MPQKAQSGFTDAQSDLIEALESHGLAEHAGYEDCLKNRQIGRSEAVQVELLSVRRSRLRGDLASKALTAMEKLVTDDKTPAATRFSAAKWILEQAGHTDQADDGRDKPLAEMTEAELRAFLIKAEATVAAGGSAPIITITPNDGALS